MMKSIRLSFREGVALRDLDVGARLGAGVSYWPQASAARLSNVT